MLKILHARLQHYANQELPDVQSVFKKAEEPKIKLPTHWIIDKAREFQKNIYLCLIDYAKAGQEAIVRTLYGKINWFKIEKGVPHGCLLSLCLFNLYTEHFMRNAGLDEL